MRKYRLPPKDERFLAYTEEELWLEFFEDQYDENPKEMFLYDLQFASGEDKPFVTGDPEIDEIERRLAAGEDPDDVFADWEGGEADGEALNGRFPEDEAVDEIDDIYGEDEDD